jgi:hypothetical protein
MRAIIVPPRARGKRAGRARPIVGASVCTDWQGLEHRDTLLTPTKDGTDT